MQITDIKFRSMPAHGKLRALVSVTFDGVLAVHDIKIIAGQDRLFLAMPSALRCANSSNSRCSTPITPLSHNKARFGLHFRL